MTKILKNISLILIGFISFVFSLVKYIGSIEKYKDEYGLDLSFNNDYVIAIIVSIFILTLGIILLVSTLSKKEHSKLLSPICGVSCSALISFYSLGYFFKQLNKAFENKDEFDYVSYQNYLYIGIVVLCVLLFFVFDIIIKSTSSKKEQA